MQQTNSSVNFLLLQQQQEQLLDMLDMLLSVLCVTVCLLLCASEGPLEVTVKPEQDATLPCRAPTRSITLLEWSRADLSADDYVFFYRNERSYENYQDPRFRGRVALKDPEMKNGDVSVVLKNVNANDSGTYECRVTIRREAASSEIRLLTNLKVTDSGDPAGGRDGYLGPVLVASVVGLFLVVVVVVVVFFLISRNRDGLKTRRSYEAPAGDAGGSVT